MKGLSFLVFSCVYDGAITDCCYFWQAGARLFVVYQNALNALRDRYPQRINKVKASGFFCVSFGVFGCFGFFRCFEKMIVLCFQNGIFFEFFLNII